MDFRFAPAAALATVLAALAFAVPSAGAASLPGAHISATDLVPSAQYPGMQHLHYEFGPIAIAPGQNSIEAKVNHLKPDVPGYITRFAPNLVYASNHQVPRVDVIHLHHGV